MNNQERNLRAEAFLEKQARIIPFSILKNIVKELKATKQLRNDIVTDAQAGSFLGNGIRYLERKNVPGAHFLSKTLTHGHKALLDADTVLAEILRGKAKEDSLRYRLLTNSENFIENSA